MVEEVLDPKNVYIIWTIEDIKTKHPDWSDDKCQEALEYCREYLQEISIERGWEIIDTEICEFERLKMIGRL